MPATANASASATDSSVKKNVTVRAPADRTPSPSLQTPTDTEPAPATIQPPRSRSTHSFEGLALDAETSDQLLTLLEASDSAGCDALIRKVFNLHPPPLPPSHFLTLSQSAALAHVYDPEVEDRVSRDNILAGLYIDAAAFGLRVGFTAWQLAIWMTVFADAHGSFTQQLTMGSDSGDEPTCSEVFIAALVRHNRPCRNIGGTPFSKQDAALLIDYWTYTYIKNQRLLAFVFGQPQDVSWTRYRAHLSTPPEFIPLAEAISAEKWEDHCRAQERAAAEKLREEMEEAQRIKQKQEDEAAAAAALKAAQVQVAAAPESPITLAPPPLAAPPLPDAAALFSPPPPIAIDPTPAGKTLAPAEIAAILSATIDAHIAALASHLDSCMDHQIGEMTRVVDSLVKDRDGGGGASGKKGAKAKTPTTEKDKGGGEKTADKDEKRAATAASAKRGKSSGKGK
ncbi:hypothetical protein HDU87_005117 [Geranomyces variabilis]|uniref:Uncharacterized protein n=1 Tax=Geranomyces variabilis TaxID=109894 RepID=A0AAD5TQL9_9FUNG|nr:hypothetical protein HDU87_005117 [Geranomyces variabilis]